MKLIGSVVIMTTIFIGVSTAKWSFRTNEWHPINGDSVKISMLTRRSSDFVENKSKVESIGQESNEGRNYEVKEPIYSNDTDINDIIEQILTSRREGRSLGEYDEIYADGNVEQALQQGDDIQARNLVKEKLCALGLLSCDIQEKRPFYSTIHAQRPPPNYGGGPYGPPKPMPQLPNRYGSPPVTHNRFGQAPVNSFGPPRKVGFEGPPVSTPFYGRPGSSFGRPPIPVNSESSITFDKPPPGAVIYGSKPPGGNSDSPYTFEQVVKEQIQVAGSQQNHLYAQQQQQQSNQIQSTATSGLQQHVHHHFHHVEGEGTAIKAPSVPIPIPGGNTINTDFSALAQSSTGFAPIITTGGFSQSSAFNAGFSGASHGNQLSIGINHKPNGDLYKPTAGFGGYGENNGLANGGNFNQLNYGQSSSSQNGLSNSYHTSNPDYYKKELQGSSGLSSQYNGYGSSQYQGGYDTSRQQIIDCTCVPFNQCPAADRIGRKEDLILPIDPRNLGKDIEAISEESSNNDTLSDNLKIQSESSDSTKKTKRETTIIAEDEEPKANDEDINNVEGRAYYGNRPNPQTCQPNEVCCRRPLQPIPQQLGKCGTRNANGITGRIKNPVYVDGDSEFGEYPWHVAILKKDPKESIYACGGTLIDGQHVITAAHCIKAQNGFDLRVRLGEWDVNHDVEFFPYLERDVISVHIHPEYYAGTLDNDLAILKFDHPVDFNKNPHISPACLPDKYSDFTGARCWTTGWGKDAFGDYGKYQNILKEVDVPILSQQHCQTQLRQTRLGYNYNLNPGFLCAGGEEGKDACKGDGGGPLVCERNGIWNVVGVVSWGIGCGQPNVPGVYVRVAHYLDWIRQITQYYK